MSAAQVVKGVSSQCLLRILKSIQPDLKSEQLQSTSRQDVHNNILLYLFLLLPHSCHSAILYAQQPSITSGSLAVPALPSHWSMTHTSHTLACVTVCMLAAASVFAQGSPALIWQPAARELPGPFHQFPTAGFPLERLRLPRRRLGRRARAAQQSETSVDGDSDGDVIMRADSDEHAAWTPTWDRPGLQVFVPRSAEALADARMSEPEVAQDEGLVVPVDTSMQLTRLSLDLRMSCKHSTPPPWHAAAQQLRTLRHLHITVHKLEHVGTLSLHGVLRHMPTLECFHVVVVPWRNCAPDTPCLLSPPADDLLDALAAAPSLSTITLQRCFSASTLEDGRTIVPADAHLRLACFTALTKLSLQGCRIQDPWVTTFVCAFRTLHGLVEVDVSDTVGGGEAVALARLAGTLPAIQHLDMAGTSSGWLIAASSHFAFARMFHGLKSLSLKKAGVGVELVAHLARAIGNLTQLQSLDLCGNEFESSGMFCVAGIVDGLVALTRLDVGHVQSTGVGALALLEAVERLRENGAGLRCLGVQGITFTREEEQLYLDDYASALRGRPELDCYKDWWTMRRDRMGRIVMDIHMALD